MTTKSRKLAWELVELFSSYSDRDIDDALTLLESGELLRTRLKLARNTAALKLKSSRPVKSTPTKSKPDQRAEYLPFDAETAAFVDAASRGHILPTSRHLREYAEILNVKLPNKLPSRSFAIKKIANALTSQSEEVRKDLVQRARGGEITESSLRAWSNLIVKS